MTWQFSRLHLYNWIVDSRELFKSLRISPQLDQGEPGRRQLPDHFSLRKEYIYLLPWTRFRSVLQLGYRKQYASLVETLFVLNDYPFDDRIQAISTDLVAFGIRNLVRRYLLSGRLSISQCVSGYKNQFDGSRGKYVLWRTSVPLGKRTVPLSFRSIRGRGAICTSSRPCPGTSGGDREDALTDNLGGPWYV